MELEACLPLLEIRFKKLCNSYLLQVFKFYKTHKIKQSYLTNIANKLDKAEDQDNRAI